MKTILSIALILLFLLGRAQQAPVFDVDKYVCKLTLEKINSITEHVILGAGCGTNPKHKGVSVTSAEFFFAVWRHPTVTEVPAKTFSSLRLCEESNTIETNYDDPLKESLIDTHPGTSIQSRAKEFREIRNGTKKPAVSKPKVIICDWGTFHLQKQKCPAITGHSI